MKQRLINSLSYNDIRNNRRLIILLTISNITKSYKHKTVLNNISLQLHPGTCFGLIGPNGAGKSTLIKIIVGIIQMDKGTVNFHHDKTINQKEKIGYVPQEVCLQETLTAEQNLLFFGKLYGFKKQELKSKIHDMLKGIGLFEQRNDKVRTFSGGMKRRLHIACALLHEPEVIIMDEPTVGIDPQSKKHIFNLIQDLKDNECTIFYASHQIDEMEKICDDITFIDSGEVILTDSLENLLSTYSTPSLYVQWEDNTAVEILNRFDNVTKEKQGWLIQTNDNNRLEVVELIIEDAKERNINIKQLAFTQNSLEDIFFSLTGNELRD